MDNVVAGDIEIKSLKLKSGDGCREVDIRKQVMRIDIFLGLHQPVIFAEFDMLDAINLYGGFPLLCQGEYIELRFRTPGVTKTAKYKLYLQSVLNQKIAEGQQSQRYTLKCVSEEWFINANKLVNKKYKTELGKAVRDIFDTNIAPYSEKSLSIEPTKGIDEMLVARKTPFQAIDQARRNAISTRHISSSFVFFENQRGFFFTTLESLFELGQKKGAGDRVFFFDKTNNIDATAITIRNIIAYNRVGFRDAGASLQEGENSNIVFAQDVLTGEVRQIRHDDGKVADKFVTADGKGTHNSATFSKKYGETTSKTMLCPINTEKPSDIAIAEKRAILQSFTVKIISNTMRLHLYGDSSMDISDIIDCKIPEVSAKSKAPKEDPVTSGKYMIATLRHVIKLGDRPNHSMYVECIKGNLLSQ